MKFLPVVFFADPTNECKSNLAVSLGSRVWRLHWSVSFRGTRAGGGKVIGGPTGATAAI